MKTLKLLAIASVIASGSAFADGYSFPSIGLTAGAIVGTSASGAVFQDHNAGNFVTSGSRVATGSEAGVSYGYNSVSAGGISATGGLAGGNGSAGYFGASGATSYISIQPRSYHHDD